MMRVYWQKQKLQLSKHFYLNFSMALSSEISRLVLYYLLSFPLPLSYLLSFSLSKKNYFFAFLLINVYYYYLICLSVLNYTVLIFVKHISKTSKPSRKFTKYSSRLYQFNVNDSSSFQIHLDAQFYL